MHRQFLIVVLIAGFAFLSVRAADGEKDSLLQRIEELEKKSKDLQAHLETLRAKDKELGIRIKSTTDDTRQAVKFVDSFSFNRVEYSGGDMPTGGTFFHQVWKNRDKKDANGNRHKIILPGLDVGPNGEVACWVIDFEK